MFTIGGDGGRSGRFGFGVHSPPMVVHVGAGVYVVSPIGIVLTLYMPLSLIIETTSSEKKIFRMGPN